MERKDRLKFLSAVDGQFGRDRCRSDQHGERDLLPQRFLCVQVITAGYAYLNGSKMCLSDMKTTTAGPPVFRSRSRSRHSRPPLRCNGDRATGVCFVFQNNPRAYANPNNDINWSGGPTAFGASSDGMGYGGLNAYNLTTCTSYGLMNSVAIAFDQFFVANSVGIYTNGATPTGSQIATGLNWSNGHPFNVTVAYFGNTLSFSMSDAVTGATFIHNFTVDIALIVGGSTAYVGFTGGTGGASSVQTVASGHTPGVRRKPCKCRRLRRTSG